MERVKNINKKLCKMISAINLNAIEKLLEQGADINCAIPTGHNNNVLPLEFAVFTKSTYMVKLIISKGADVTANDNAALLRAIILGEKEIIKTLIEYGADINFRGSFLMKQYYKDEQMAFYLLDKGINPHFAIEYGKDNVKLYAEKLIEKKALQEKLELSLHKENLPTQKIKI